MPQIVLRSPKLPLSKSLLRTRSGCVTINAERVSIQSERKPCHDRLTIGRACLDQGVHGFFAHDVSGVGCCTP
jgi:hypothetical protein